MSTHQIKNGNEALALAMRQINPDVVAAYPITPTSYVVEKFSKFVADGQVDTEFVPCESEHSAMSACLGAAAAGARAMTATASQGLALMHEVLFNAAGSRLPTVLLNGNRALSAPLSIHGDHSDVMAERDTGWIQIFAGNVQEAYDLALQAFPIAEDGDVRTPVMICFDAFDTSHMTTNFEMLADADVTDFLGETITEHSLTDLENPVSHGSYTNPNFYFEHRRSQHEGLVQAKRKILETGSKFSKLSGRFYENHFETYELEDAETVAVVLGSAGGTMREVVKKLREKGEKVGLLRLRTFRPFPSEALAEALKNAKNVAILDRVMPTGVAGGPLFNELNSALAVAGLHPKTANFIFGIGQRAFEPAHAEQVFEAFKNPNLDMINFVNLRS